MAALKPLRVAIYEPDCAWTEVVYTAPEDIFTGVVKVALSHPVRVVAAMATCAKRLPAASHTEAEDGVVLAAGLAL